MSQLRLVYSKTDGSATSRSKRKSAPPSLVLPEWQSVSWKLELLAKVRPAAVEVIERLVDDLLREAEGRKL